jgi:hypothetical protein
MTLDQFHKLRRGDVVSVGRRCKLRVVTDVVSSASRPGRTQRITIRGINVERPIALGMESRRRIAGPVARIDDERIIKKIERANDETK